ncbi:hypothetical protein BCR43DRAFT_454436 [Syncephalastrum racemosum]|uniref:GAT domain-containing protein n=1 Tax=Syncephalastrum racemosum TaxID=13706 RepID=A0A1X2HQU8_SYNRA|nr:hypothetical protein BCR43DRAFT_454436 [Syncephalastrum racemosum]
MDPHHLRLALEQLPHDTLLTEIPTVQNAIAQLLRSNVEMREFDPKGEDPDLVQAIAENQDVLQRYEARIDMTLEVIRQRIGEAAAREMASNVEAFRKQHPTTTPHADEPMEEENEGEQGVFL